MAWPMQMHNAHSARCVMLQSSKMSDAHNMHIPGKESSEAVLLPIHMHMCGLCIRHLQCSWSTFKSRCTCTVHT